MTSKEEPEPGAQGEGKATLPDIALTSAIEAMLFVSDEALSAERMAAVAAVPVDAVRAALVGLSDQLTSRSSGLALREFSSGWRLTTAPECAPLLERFVVEGQSGRLSPAALETLAVVAYRQPVSRGRIAAIRGVAVDGVVRTLLNRGLLHEVGTEPSGAVLYGVTGLFLDKLGVSSVTELPSLAPLLPELETIDDLSDQSEKGFVHQQGPAASPEASAIEIADHQTPYEQHAREMHRSSADEPGATGAGLAGAGDGEAGVAGQTPRDLENERTVDATTTSRASEREPHSGMEPSL